MQAGPFLADAPPKTPEIQRGRRRWKHPSAGADRIVSKDTEWDLSSLTTSQADHYDCCRKRQECFTESLLSRPANCESTSETPGYVAIDDKEISAPGTRGDSTSAAQRNPANRISMG